MAVVVAIRGKQYDAEENKDVLDASNLILPFPPELERRADLVVGKLMMDGSESPASISARAARFFSQLLLSDSRF